MRRCTVVLALLFTPAVAQTQPADDGALSTATALFCQWYDSQSVDWEGVRPKFDEDNGNDVPFLEITFFSIGPAEAQMAGNLATVAVTVIRTADGLHFVEHPPGGGITLTSVFDSSQQGIGPLHYRAVHSRHYAVGDPAVWHYYGLCYATNPQAP